METSFVQININGTVLPGSGIDKRKTDKRGLDRLALRKLCALYKCNFSSHNVNAGIIFRRDSSDWRSTNNERVHPRGRPVDRWEGPT